MRLHVRETGSGPATAVLLHAFPLDHQMWQPQMAAFDGMRVLAPDFPGFGASPASPGWTLDDVAHELAHIIDEEKCGPCHVAGVSMGGYAAIQFCRRFPGHVKTLTLASTRARADNDAERTARLEFAHALRTQGASILAERMLRRLLKQDVSESVYREVSRIIGNATADAAADALDAIRIREDNDRYIESFDRPVLVISGGQDVIISEAESREWASRIPGARYAVMEGAGHLPNIEEPEEFNRIWREFLNAA